MAFVAADGRRRRLGSKEPGTPLVASADDGWAAWIEKGSDARLVVHDASRGSDIATYDGGSAPLRPVAIDQGRVYFATSDGSFAWQPGSGDPERITDQILADVESTTWVLQRGDAVQMVQGFFNVAFTRPGEGALLSPGGTYVLSKAPRTPAGTAYRPLLYDARSGDALPTGLGSRATVLDATFGDNSRTVYLVADDAADDLLVLRTCALSARQCSDVALIRVSEDRPLLAH